MTDDLPLLPPPHDPAVYGYTSADMRAYGQACASAAVARERERAAKVCEAEQDYKEEARAIVAASRALKDNNITSSISRLQHESAVRLMNNALAKSAAAIRKGE